MTKTKQEQNKKKTETKVKQLPTHIRQNANSFLDVSDLFCPAQIQRTAAVK
jgi:hypothetical protein